MEKIIHYYRKTEPSQKLLPSVKEELKALGLVDDSAKIQSVETESCFNVKLDADLSEEQTQKLEWLLAETFDRGAICLEKSFFEEAKSDTWKAEFGPRMTFTSAFSSNASSICQACGLPITRLELSRRFSFSIDGELSEQAVATLKFMLHDRMTEQEYTKALTSFDSGAQAKPVKTVPIMEQGRAALELINKEMGLGFDEFDLDYYTDLFKVSLLLVACHPNVQHSSDDSTHDSHPSSCLLERAMIGETRTRSYRSRVLRYGPIQLRALSSLVFQWKDDHRRGGKAKHTLQDGQGHSSKGRGRQLYHRLS